MARRDGNNGRLIASAILGVLVLLAAAGWVFGIDRGDSASQAPVPRATQQPKAKPAPKGWVPTAAESARARSIADKLSLKDLAGQLIIARSFDEESSLALVRKKHF